MGIRLSHIRKRFGDTVVLDDVSLEVQTGEFIALLGPSGSGKTTLLRIIAGMEFADSGCILLDGKESSDADADRRVGFVFQHYALFKHMSVFENVAFGLRVRPRRVRPSRHEIRARVRRLLALVHMEAFHDHYPAQLSGGQRQRVALARALAVEPKMLLLDEPFGALDAKVRKELRRWMRRLHDDLGVTSLFVTHDQEEAMEVADRVVVMSHGRIEQFGTPGEVYHHPANSFVYDFLGNYNVFEGWRDEAGITHLLEAESDAAVASVPIPATQRGWLARYPEVGRLLRHLLPRRSPAAPGPVYVAPVPSPHANRVRLFARPHELFIARKPDGHEYVRATILYINPAGPLVKIEMERPEGSVLTAELPIEVVETLALRRGDEVLVRPKQTRVFGDELVG